MSVLWEDGPCSRSSGTAAGRKPKRDTIAVPAVPRLTLSTIQSNTRSVAAVIPTFLRAENRYVRNRPVFGA